MSRRELATSGLDTYLVRQPHQRPQELGEMYLTLRRADRQDDDQRRQSEMTTRDGTYSRELSTTGEVDPIQRHARIYDQEREP